MLTAKDNRELLAQDDGRLKDICVFKHEDGSLEYKAGFNRMPYGSERITEKQYEFYKKLCKPAHEYSLAPDFMIEYWICAPYDDGLPKLPNWFKKLF